LRLGEPLQVCVVTLQPGAVWPLAPASADVGRDWLLVEGAAQLKAEGEEAVALGPLDYHVQGAGPSHQAVCLRAGEAGATLMLRERALPLEGGSRTCTARESPEAWEDYAPLIKRRVLWRHGPMAAMLWLAAPGATVPHHEHGHDEECLMLRGDLFQDDYLLREGDYQLAPGGSSHETVNTDTGALIFAHGDLDMRIV
jgi:quercetin dioxygenase-like cupin family protein